MKTKYLLLGGAVVLVGATAWVGSVYFAETNSLGPTSTTTSTPSTEPTTSTTTSVDQVVGPKVLPGRDRTGITAARSGFIDASGRQVSVVTVDGDYVLVDADSGETTVVYNARDLTLWLSVGVLRTGSVSADDPFLRAQMAAQGLVALALETGTSGIRDVNGRQVVETSYEEDFVFDGVQVVREHTVTVDIETGLIVRHDIDQKSPEVAPEDANRESVAGDVTTGFSIDDDVVAERAAEQTIDDGYQLLSSIAEAEALAGYPVSTPSWMPEGFVLTQIAYGSNPGGIMNRQSVVVLTYRNWAWEVDVTFRDASVQEQWDDPFDPEQLLTPTTVVGAFEIFASNGTFPAHAWGVDDGRLITIAGGVGPEALAKIVEGLSDSAS